MASLSSLIFAAQFRHLVIELALIGSVICFNGKPSDLGSPVRALNALPLKLYPVLVNAVLLIVFGLSLWRPPSVVERLARLTQPDLPPRGVAYTRQVTRVWCAFFVVNGGLAAATALWASDAVWALYNGLLAYGLMGALFAGEWLVRQRVMKRHGHV